jgi:pimeloyl-ACP methyl ester carboxylesterase
LKRIILFSLLVLCVSGCGEGDSVSSLDGVPIAFEKTGSGETTLVFVHAWSCDQTYWREQVPALEDRFTVVTLDLAGHGASGLARSDYTIKAFGEDVAAVVSALDLNNVYLIGHSMGGSVIIEAARLLQGRVVGLIGVDTLQQPGWNLTEAQVAGFLAPMEADYAARTREFVTTMFPAGSDTALVRRVAEDMAAAPANVALSSMRNLLLHDLRPTLSLLDVPLWCLNSNQTPVDFQGWKFYGPGYTAVLMEGVGHFLFLEKPDEFNEKLVDLVERMGNRIQ